VCTGVTCEHVCVFVCMVAVNTSQSQLMCTHTQACPQTEQIRLEIITTAKISDKFSQESEYISNTFSWESSNFPTSFQVFEQVFKSLNRVPQESHSKDL